MHEVGSEASSADAFREKPPYSEKTSEGDAKAAILWQGHGEAIAAAKLDALQNAPPKILDKRAITPANIKLYKAYTEEYIKQLKVPAQKRTALKVSQAAKGLGATSNVQKAEIALDTLRQMEKEHLASLYGNKAANLIELEGICETLRSKGISVQVPPFCPISHDEVQQHLNRYYPDYKKDWEAFAAIQRGKKGLTSEGRELLDKIQLKIEKAFAEHPFEPAVIGTFLKSQKDSRLMVRSTGKEDSAKSANAGGNLSEAGVLPDARSVSTSIGKVIASYHSPLSLTQRLLAEDEVAESPFTPVLLQKMIGEKPAEVLPAAHIPVSGVVYTRELLAETELLTQIQATYGHNEAVVMSSLPVDTYYVYKDGNHHDVVVPKEFRLVADPKVGFITKVNRKEISTKSALEAKQVQDLQKISEEIHKTYGKPQDIEWVYNPALKTFFIVQTRDLVRRYEQDPMSIDVTGLCAQSKTVRAFDGSSIVNRGIRATLIASEKEVIVDVNLERAFNRYWRLAQTEEGREQIKAVIVKEPAASTSHFACTLREMGVAVICVPNFDQKQLRSKSSYALIDHLEGKLFIVDPKDKAPKGVDGLIESGAVKRGWSKHPIAAKETVQAAEVVSELCHNVLDGYTSKGGPHSAQELRALLKAIGSEDQRNAKLAVQQLTYWIYREVQKLQNDPELYSRAIVLLQNVVVIANQLIKDTTTRLQQLHLAKRLEALVCQERTAHIVNADALLQILAERGAVTKVQATKVELSEAEKTSLAALETKTPLSPEEIKRSLAIYAQVGKLITTPEAKQAWNELSQKIAYSGARSANRQLLDLIHLVQAVGVFGEWINISFSNVYRSSSDKNCFEILRTLDKEISQSIKTLKVVSDAEARLKRWNQLEDQWADPAKFEKLTLEFQQTVLKDIEAISTLFASSKDAPLLARKALMTYLQNAVDLYDRSIKSMRSSPQYENKKELQAERFHKMLQGYFQIMKKAIEAIPNEAIMAWARGFKLVAGGERLYTDPQYFKERVSNRISQILENIAKAPMTETQLRPSSGFNVLSGAINSGAYESVELLSAKTLEDLFTLIHQNILASYMGTFQTPWKGHLPSELENLQKTVEGLKKDLSWGGGQINIEPNLLDVSYKYPDLTVKYSIPLKLHAATITITYNVTTGNAHFDFRLLGHNLGDRMNSIAKKLFVESAATANRVATLPLYDENRFELSMAWAFTKEELASPTKLQDLQKILDRAFNDTFSGTWGVVKVPQFASFDPGTFRTLWTAPEILGQWVEMGCPHIAEIIRFLLDTNHEADAILLLDKLGIKAAISDEPFEKRVGKAVLQAIAPDGALRKFESGNELIRWISSGERQFEMDEVQAILPKLLYELPQDRLIRDFLREMQITVLSGYFEREWAQSVSSQLDNFDSIKWQMAQDLTKNRAEWDAFLMKVDSIISEREKRAFQLKSFGALYRNNPEVIETLTKNPQEAEKYKEFFIQNWSLFQDILQAEIGEAWQLEDSGYWHPDSLSSEQLNYLGKYMRNRWEKFERVLLDQTIQKQGQVVSKKVLEKEEMHNIIRFLAENRQFDTLMKILQTGTICISVSSKRYAYIPLPDETHKLIESFLTK